MHIIITSFRINLCANKSYLKNAETPRIYRHPRIQNPEKYTGVHPPLLKAFGPPPQFYTLLPSPPLCDFVPRSLSPLPLCPSPQAITSSLFWW